MRNIGSTLWLLPRKIVSGLVCIYQATLSPDHGPLRHTYPYGFCRHEPTCSQYAKQILERRGLVVGTALTCKRLLQCTPWNTPDDKRLKKAVSASLKMNK